MIDKWQLYSQTGVDGPEYGVRIRPGYTVVGFQKEDAQAIVAWQNASIQPEGDILERAKAQLAEGYTAINESVVRELIAKVERLRSVEAQQLIALESTASIVEHQDTRIKELEAERALFCSPGSTLEAALIQLREARERIKELEFMQSRHTWQCASCEYNPSDGSVIGKDPYVKRLEAAFLEAKRCPTCNGAGKLIDVVISRKLGRVESERVCPLCEGKGEEKAREALEELRVGGGKDEN